MTPHYPQPFTGLPISSAPKNGSKILVWWMNSWRSAYYDPDRYTRPSKPRWVIEGARKRDCTLFPPEQWYPLPPDLERKPQIPPLYEYPSAD